MLVRKLRLQKGWSQDHLAELTGVSTRTIQRIERGYKPGLETVKALASVFEVDVSTFTTEELTMNINENTTDKKYLASDEKVAIEYIKGIKEFYTHLTIYLVYIVLYGVIYGGLALALPGTKWQFAIKFLSLGAIGWGIGLLIHGLVAFEKINIGWFSADWERRAVEKRLGRKL